MSREQHEPQPVLPPLLAEQLLIESFPSDLTGQQALVVSPGRAQLGSFLLHAGRYVAVQAWFLDLHDASMASLSTSEQAHDAGGSSPHMEVLCGSDLPDGPFDLVTLPILKRAESELTRELLQQAHQRLVAGGILAASVDNPKDNWLHGQLRSMLDKVTCVRGEKGCVYWGRKTRDLKKTKDFHAEFAFRDDAEHLIRVFSRPGVFAHRRLDPGARQLMLAADIGPRDQVLDMGCGAGAVSLAAAFQTSGQVFAVDSNARAIECLKRGAETNELNNVVPVWNADGQLDLPVPIDIALANPPYYGNDAISQHFVEASLAALRSGGALLVVTKKPNWYAAYFEQRLEDVAIMEASRYFIACGRKP